MKKIIALLLVLLTIFSFAACSKTKSPKDVLERDLKTFVKANFDEDGALDGLYDLLGKKYTDKFVSLLKEFDYEILEETLNDTTATVKVKITTYPFGQMYIEAIGEYVLQAISLAFSNPDITEEEIAQLLGDIIIEKMNTLEKTYTQTLDVTYILEGDQWVIDNDSTVDILTNVIFGGMMEALEDAASGFDF